MESADAAFDPASLTKSHHDGVPRAALSRLPALHGEASRNMVLSRFLARSPQACITLMLVGAVVLTWSSVGAGAASPAPLLLAPLAAFAASRRPGASEGDGEPGEDQRRRLQQGLLQVVRGDVGRVGGGMEDPLRPAPLKMPR